MKCGQKTCDGEAITVFLWPGADELPACLPCAIKAYRIAEVMGFKLPFRPDILPALEKIVADQVIHHVKRDESSGE